MLGVGRLKTLEGRREVRGDERLTRLQLLKVTAVDLIN
jgi:hypothetical protein